MSIKTTLGGGKCMETYQTVHLWLTSRFMSFCKAMCVAPRIRRRLSRIEWYGIRTCLNKSIKLKAREIPGF